MFILAEGETNIMYTPESVVVCLHKAAEHLTESMNQQTFKINSFSEWKTAQLVFIELTSVDPNLMIE